MDHLKVVYRLVTTLGATVATGTLQAVAGGTGQQVNFATVTPSTGLYYLLLENKQLTARLKLVRN